MRVNASEAACLIGVTEKTLRQWCADKKVRATKVKQLGQPVSWMIELEDLLALPLDRDRLRLQQAWLDLHRAALNVGPANVSRDTPPPPSSSATLPVATGTSMGGTRNLPAGSGGLLFGTRADAARWLLRHGVNSESTPKDWPGWRDVALDPEDVLALAIRVCDPANHRITWRLHRCDEASCVCQRML